MPRPKKIKAEVPVVEAGVVVSTKDPTQSMKDLNKRFGFEALRYADAVEPRERIEFKQGKLNALTGGGLTYGQFHCIWGGKASGKTSVVLDMIAKAQSKGKVCVYCDLEHSYNADWAKARGVDTSKLLYGDFYYAEQPLDSIIEFCKSKTVDLIIIDSIHGLSPKSEQEEKSGKEKSTENDSMALVARKLSQFFRMAAGYVSNANVCVLLIGQTRKSLGYICLDTLSGGNALLHWCSSILNLRRGQTADAPTLNIKDESGKSKKVIIGFNCVIKVEKSKLTGCVERAEAQLPFYQHAGLQDEPLDVKPEDVRIVNIEETE